MNQYSEERMLYLPEDDKTDYSRLNSSVPKGITDLVLRCFEGQTFTLSDVLRTLRDTPHEGRIQLTEHHITYVSPTGETYILLYHKETK